jgi:hypothetical protein
MRAGWGVVSRWGNGDTTESSFYEAWLWTKGKRVVLTSTYWKLNIATRSPEMRYRTCMPLEKVEWQLKIGQKFIDWIKWKDQCHIVEEGQERVLSRFIWFKHIKHMYEMKDP